MSIIRINKTVLRNLTNAMRQKQNIYLLEKRHYYYLKMIEAYY